MATPQPPIERAHPMIRTWFQATVRPVCFALVCAAGLATGNHASAREYALRNVGGWTVTASKDGKGCFLTREYERSGETTLLLGLNIDGTNRLSVLNANWSIKPKDRLKLDFRLSDSSYPAHLAVGMTSEGKRGFVTGFGTKFPSYFATSKALHISRGDVPIERLSLDGSGAAVAELRTCVAAQREKPAATASQAAHPDDIPKDPFALAPARRSRK